MRIGLYDTYHKSLTTLPTGETEQRSRWKQPVRVETTDSVIQWLLELVTLLSYFIEIEKTDAGKHVCKMYPGK